MRRWPVLLGAQLLSGAALAAALWIGHPFGLSDVTLYFQWSGQVVDGLIPYRDFFFDYPPLSLPALLFPRLATGFADITYGTYVVVFATSMALLSIGLAQVARVTAHVSALDASVARDYFVPLTLAMPLLLIRFEPWPIILTALAFLAAIRGRPALSGVWLGLGIAAKLYPAVLLPAFAVHSLVNGDARRAGIHVVAALLVAIVLIGGVALVSGGAILDTLAFQQGRGLQVETAAAGVIQLLNLGSRDQLEIVHATTHELRSSQGDAYLAVQPAVVAVVMLLVAGISAYRIRQSAGTPQATQVLAATSVALLIGFILTNRALSPQHVLWLLPFFVVLPGPRRWLLVAIIGLTLLVFPVLYAPLLEGDAVAVLALNARNLLLAVLGGWLLARPLDR